MSRRAVAAGAHAHAPAPAPASACVADIDTETDTDTDTIDWSPLLPHWDRRAFHLARAAAPPLSPGHAFDLIVRAAEPFRAGTRFMALPDVRFYLDGGVLRAPGDLLPGPEDRGDPLRYVQRVRERLHGAHFQLRVTQPLFLDYRLWSRTRALLADLFARIGCPALPVEAALWVGQAAPQTVGTRLQPRHACLRLPLLGACTAQLWRARPSSRGAPERQSASQGEAAGERAPAATLHARAGDVLCWPGRWWHRDSDDGAGLGLSLAIPSQGGDAMIAVKDALAESVDAALGEDERVAMLSYPPRARAGRGIAAVAPLARVGAAMRAAATRGDLQQALRVAWIARVSAGALEPPPPPRDDYRLRPDDRVRLDPRNPLLRMREGEQWWWAVNGHVFAMPDHPYLDALLTRLRDGGAGEVARLCARGRRGRPDPGLVQLLQRLYELRGLRLRARADA